MNKEKFLNEKMKALITQGLSFLTLILETIVGVALFLTWTLHMQWGFINRNMLVPLQWFQGSVLVIVFILTFFLLYPLSDPVPPLMRIFIVAFLSLLSIGMLNLTSVFTTWIPDSLCYIASVTFMFFVLGSYVMEFFVRKGTLHKILNSNSLERGLRHTLKKTGDLPHKMYWSLILALGGWGTSLAIGIIWKGKRGWLEVLLENAPTITIVGVFVFVLLLGLLSILTEGQPTEKEVRISTPERDAE